MGYHDSINILPCVKGVFIQQKKTHFLQNFSLHLVKPGLLTNNMISSLLKEKERGKTDRSSYKIKGVCFFHSLTLFSQHSNQILLCFNLFIKLNMLLYLYKYASHLKISVLFHHPIKNTMKIFFIIIKWDNYRYYYISKQNFMRFL